MNEEKPAVETEVVAAAPQQEVDYEAILKQKDEEIAQVQQEKENYRKGMLKAKGKLPEESSDNDTPEDMEALIDRKVQEKFLSTKEAQLLAEKDIALKAVLKQNKELTLALKNRAQISSTSGQGSNQDKPEGKTDNILSNDQINALKAQGKDDKWIAEFKKNLIKTSTMPK